MKAAKPILGKMSNAMLDALIAISSRVVTISRGVGIRDTYSVVKEDGQESVIKAATIDALNKRNLLTVKLVSAYRPGSGSTARLRLAKGVAEHLPLGVGLR
jgi:hypothetical protein